MDELEKVSQEQSELPEQEPVMPEQPAYEPPKVWAAEPSGAGEARKPSPFADSPYVMCGRQDGPQGYRPPYQPQPPVKKPAGEKKTFKRVLCGALVLALVAGSCTITAKVVERRFRKQYELLSLNTKDRIQALEDQIRENTQSSDGNSSSGTPNVNEQGGLTPAQVYAQNVGSVVAIECGSKVGQMVQTVSSGSGFVLTEDGYIVSNYHVVEGAAKLTVVFSDGEKHDATYIGGDEANDIALLKIEAAGLRPVKVGRSDDLIVGDQVAAIGNPLGELASTLTVGYVSAKDRVITTDGTQINMMQTDAAINSGNSGGPLFNMDGEVVGITTAKYSGTTSSGATIEGIGFAIPMDDVLDMLQDLRQYGYITGAYLGVTVSNVDQDATELYGLPLGALVHEAVAGGCAHAAGIRAQDIIVELGGYEIENLNDLTRALRKFKAGQTVSVVVYRHAEGGEVLVSVTLDPKPQAEPQSQQAGSDSGTPSNGTADEWFEHFFG